MKLSSNLGLLLASASLAAVLVAVPAFAAASKSGPKSALWRQFMAARNAGEKHKAIEILERGVAQGDAEAQAQLGEEYRGGDFELQGAVPIDYKKSYELTRMAVEQGNIRAMTDMGVVYMRGIGVDKNYAEALKWFVKATDGGDMKAPRYAGINYENGYGTAVDYARAMQYYRKAAGLGDITGQCLLGSLYERGLGVDKDYTQAGEWYLKSAARGDLVASAGMESLGNLYETRADGKQNLQTALEWYRKAARVGNPVAKADVARLSGGDPRPLAAGRNLCLSPFP